MRVPVKRRRDDLLVARIRQQVARDLLEREPVVGLVGVERTDDVIAIRPDRAAGSSA
jgi:hypothetical protein